MKSYLGGGGEAAKTMAEKGYEGTSQSVTSGREWRNPGGSGWPEWRYVIIWEFQVREGMEARFEQAYGTRGLWAQFFAAGQGYLGTELIRDAENQQRYVTLDFWTSRAAYRSFRDENLQRYAEIDRECEAMTTREIEIGGWERVPGG